MYVAFKKIQKKYNNWYKFIKSQELYKMQLYESRLYEMLLNPIYNIKVHSH